MTILVRFVLPASQGVWLHLSGWPHSQHPQATFAALFEPLPRALPSVHPQLGSPPLLPSRHRWSSRLSSAHYRAVSSETENRARLVVAHWDTRPARANRDAACSTRTGRGPLLLAAPGPKCPCDPRRSNPADPVRRVRLQVHPGGGLLPRPGYSPPDAKPATLP